MSTPHALIFTSDGLGHGLHTERIDLGRIGDLQITRASQVEFDNHAGLWRVLLPPGQQPLFSHPSREVCLDWERAYLQEREDRKHNEQRIQSRPDSTAAGT